MRALDKIVERTELGVRLGARDERNGKVVFACGVFDLLHIGHVRYLEFARGLGSMLIVGVNSDASVKTLDKAAARPIVPQAERAEIVAALASVDYVCLFDEKRPDATIIALRPDIHVKSAQYEGKSLPEAAAVDEVGGVVVFAPHISSHSTTSLVERLLATGSQ